MSVKFQFSKLIMEKFLRRSFYDAVLRLYETAHGARIISVSLEGHLSLVVNKNENFVIKLNEIAQRADDAEDPHQHRLTKFVNFKPEESTDSYFVKKEDDFDTVPAVTASSAHSEVVVNLDDHLKEDEKLISNMKVTTEENQFVNSSERLNYFTQQDVPGVKGTEQKESIDYKQSESSSADLQQNHHADQSLVSHEGRIVQESTIPKVDLDSSGAEDICFLPVGQVDGEKRKLEFDYQGQGQVIEKKMSQKRRKLSAFPDMGEEGSAVKSEEKEKEEPVAAEAGDVNANSLQLLPHTGELVDNQIE